MKPTLTTKFFVDLSLWSLCVPIAFWLRLDGGWVHYVREIVVMMALGVPLKAGTIYGLGLYRRSWHRTGVRDLMMLVFGIGIVTLVLFLLAHVRVEGLAIPRSAPLISGMLALLILCGARMAMRIYAEQTGLLKAGKGKDIRRVLIAGAGEAGTLVAREMLRNPASGRVPVGFLDDDPTKRRQLFLGLPVPGRIEDLPAVMHDQRVDEVVIAMPSAGGSTIRRVVQTANEAGVAYRIIPGIFELLSGRVSISHIREVEVEDLLRREPVRLDMQEIGAYLEDRVVLVTGAGGSIGSEIVRQVATFGPATLVLLGRGENSIYQIDREMAQEHPEIRRFAVVTDIRDRTSLEAVFRRHRPDVIFHAGAHKHVPLMEQNPAQAVLNNVGGTKNLVELALAFGVERFVNVSTDKAVNPTSVMGASKRVAELVVYDASRRCKNACTYVSVRFGNVLGSRGSVIPLFKEQIRQGGPITITHPEMVRYFMTIPEASQLVLQAGSMAENGNVYVLDMGEPVKILDLARDLILLSGLQLEDIEIRYSGIRPGEKLYEELMTAEEGIVSSCHEKVFVARKSSRLGESFTPLLESLFAAAEAQDEDRIRDLFKQLIPTHCFAPSGGDGAPATPVAPRSIGETNDKPKSPSLPSPRTAQPERNRIAR